MTKKLEFANPQLSPSAAGRFLGLKQPDSDPDPFELDESDVVWSATSSLDDVSESSETHSISPPAATSSLDLRRKAFRPKSGLSAALAGDSPASLVRRKSTLNPILSVASAARLIPPVPVHVHGGGTRFPLSAPVNVPVWPKKAPLVNFDEVDDDVADGEEEEMVPPHVMVARSQMTTFSVFEGVGRTLKGRDLRSVRNAVFQKTGFID